jgi:hypothetical protein
MEPVKPNYIPHVAQPAHPVYPMPLPHPMPMPLPHPMPAQTHPIHFEQMTLTENVHLNAYAPHHPHPHPHPVVCRPMASGALLVLFILLVIISRSHGGVLPRK